MCKITKMTAIARIAVISAVFYLFRFALAHQLHTQSEYSESDSTSILQEFSVSEYDASDEKVLIRSGVPLRGRTIHQTAWSEEEKVQAPGNDLLQQPRDQNSKEHFYDGWILTNAINYILSFIYDSEIEDSAVISSDLPENPDENSKLPNYNFEEKKTQTPSAKIDIPDEKSKNIPMFNRDSGLETTHNAKGNQEDQGIEWFRKEMSSLSDEYTYPESYIQTNEFSDEYTYPESDIETNEFSDEYTYPESDIETNEFSDENLDYEYEENSHNHEDNVMINEGKVSQMHGSVIPDTKDNSAKNNIANPSSSISETESEFVSIGKSEEPNQDSDRNKHGKNEKDYIRPGNTETDFRQSNEYNNNIVQNANLHPKQKSRNYLKEVKEAENFFERTNLSPEAHSVEYIPAGKPTKEDEEIDEWNEYATTTETSFEMITIKIPTTTSHIQNQAKPQNKGLSPESASNVQTEQPDLSIDKNIEQGNKHESNHMISITANFNELQREEVSEHSNYATKPTFKYTDRTQMNRQLKINSSKDNKDKDGKISSIPENKSKVAHIKPSQFPNIKSLKHRDKGNLKSKQRYLSDIYFDLEPDDDVRSYNYLLDSYEFIRINNNKVDKKHDDSIYVIIQDKELGAGNMTSSILSHPSHLQGQKEVDVTDKPHKSFDTILEYLYQNTNNSFILSLKEHNSTGN